MPVGDKLSLRVCGRYQDQNVVNTLHYIVTGQDGADPAVCQDLADVWAGNRTTEWLDAHKDSYELVGVKAYAAAGKSRPPGFNDIGDFGNVVGEPSPSYLCRVITFYGDDPVARRNGRVMLSGGTTDMFDPTDGSVTGAARTELNVLGNYLRQTLEGNEGTYDLVIFNPNSGVSANIISHQGRKTPALLRSRRVRTYSIG